MGNSTARPGSFDVKAMLRDMLAWLDAEAGDSPDQLPAHVGALWDQHLAPPPAVQEHPGERPDHRERNQQRGERLRDVGGRGLLLRGEHHVRGQRDLEHPVPALRRQPNREQPPEIPPPQQRPQIPDEPHACTVTAGPVENPRPAPTYRA